MYKTFIGRRIKPIFTNTGHYNERGMSYTDSTNIFKKTNIRKTNLRVC